MKLHRNMRRSQQGSIVVTTAIALSLIVILLIGSELGYLFFLKRELQKTADLAALAGANSVTTSDCSAGRAAALSNANTTSTGNMPAALLPLAAGEVTCGRWTSAGTVPNSASRFTSATSNLNAVQVQFSRTPESLLAFFTGSRTIAVHAIAAKSLPMAQLSIGSTLLSVNSENSEILNALFGGLLGGAVNIDAVGWNGLINTNISLLSYLDQLAVTLGVTGGYDQVISTQTSTGTLVQAMIAVLQKDSNTSSAVLAALNSIYTSANIGPIRSLSIGDIVGLQSGSLTAGLSANLQVLQILQGAVQVANGKNAVVASVPLTIGGLSVAVHAQIVERPQLSAIGNPVLAAADPTGPNAIAVRTAAVRTLISVDLGKSGDLLTSLISGLLTAVNNLTSSITSILNSIINFNPPSNCNGLLKVGCHSDESPVISDIAILPLPLRIDINIDLAAANSYAQEVDCTNSGNQTLKTHATSSIAKLKIGKMGDNANDAVIKVFSSATEPTVTPVPLLDIGTVPARFTCLVTALGLCVGSTIEYKMSNGNWTSSKTAAGVQRTAFGGGGVALYANSTIAPSSGASSSLTFNSNISGQLLELDAKAPPAQTYLNISAANGGIFNSLSSTISNLKVVLFSPGTSTGTLGSIVNTTVAAFTTVVNLLQTLITPLLTSLVDPILSTLLNGLGIDLAAAQVGARLSCSKGAELVY